MKTYYPPPTRGKFPVATALPTADTPIAVCLQRSALLYSPSQPIGTVPIIDAAKGHAPTSLSALSHSASCIYRRCFHSAGSLIELNM